MAKNEFDDDDFPPRSGPSATGIVAMVLPFATAIAALLVGAVLGFAIGLVVKPAEVIEKPIPRELTAAELASACAPTVEQTVDKLEKAETRVKGLEQEVADRNARVAELEAGQKKGGGGGGGVSKELAQARRDLEEARAQLEIAQQEKAQLVVELTQTKETLAKTELALVEQKEMTHDAREDALVNKYFRFVNDAQLEVCEKGSRKKMGNCRADVQAALQQNTKRRDKFSHCVRSGQATPTVREIQKGQSLPDYSEWVNEEEKTTRGYYVLFCDPTLPEKADGDLAEQHLPTTPN